jgi:type IV pilus assembly protein PilY1
VGGRGSAGAGFYALDVSNPKGSTGSATDSPSDANVAARVLWEFPSASTSADVVKTLGVSLGKPVIANSHKYGPVVVLSSGYNATADGKGRVFVLNALTGALLKTFVTTAGALGTGDAGLTQLAGFTEADGTVNYLYGGDLLGNVWRFSLEDGSMLRLATLADNAGNAQPVTAIPELATVNRRRMVFVGTGRLLAQSDFADTKVQSFYALWDKNTTIANPRASLAARSMAVNAGTRMVSGSAIDWGTQLGWFVDLPAGEKANTDPTIAYGILSFTTNNPTGATCSVSSALYLANLATGLQLADGVFAAGQAIYGLQLGNTLTGRASVSRLPSGAIEVVTHQSDNSSAGRLLNPSANAKPVKAAWKAVLR